MTDRMFIDEKPISGYTVDVKRAKAAARQQDRSACFPADQNWRIERIVIPDTGLGDNCGTWNGLHDPI
jgi:hypothetical protein